MIKSISSSTKTSRIYATNHHMVIFNSKQYDEESFKEYVEKYRACGISLEFVDSRLDESTAQLAVGAIAVCVFVNDVVSASVVEILQKQGTKLITLRCAGFDRVDLEACRNNKVSVTRVPKYSPFAVAEHAVALAFALNRGLIKSSANVSKGDFRLTKPVLGFDIRGKTIGIVGTGNIGRVVGDIFSGFGCTIVCYDVYKSAEFAALSNVTYCDFDEVLEKSDIISLHLPLLDTTHHIINKTAIEKMKPNCLLVNTSRGGLIDTAALLDGLDAKKISGAGLDVYENESDYFFEDLSNKEIPDPILKRLMNHPRVILTPHQAFFTKDALAEIAKVTFDNVKEFIVGGLELDALTNTCL